MKVTERRLRQTTERAELARQDRDELIRLASERDGLSRRKVAAATGLSVARIQQIVAGAMLLLCLVFPGVVQGSVKAGSTEVVAADGSPDFPYQRWANRSQVPTPRATITVMESSPSPCPAVHGCWLAESLTIHFHPAVEVRFAFRHELGHAFDDLHLDNMERAKYQELRKRPGAWPTEAFANSYAWCAQRERVKNRLERTCELIRRAA